MNLSKLSALFFGAPAKTAGKRAVKFQKITPLRMAIEPTHEYFAVGVTVKNDSPRTVFITIEVNFTKAGKK